MKILKRWNVAECGWDVYYSEVAALSKGRVDVRIQCLRPGHITLIEF